MKTGTVYTLSNPITEEIFYVGQTYKSLVSRLDGHVGDSKRYNTNVCKKIRELRSKKIKPIIKELEQSNDQSSLDFLEIYYISLFKSWGFILENQTFGGKGKAARGFNPSKETRKKWSINRTGEGNPFYGKTHTDEVRRLISITNKGRKRTEEFKQRRRELQKDWKPSKEMIDRMIDRHGRRVIQLSKSLEFIEEFYTIREAAEKTNSLDEKINNVCKKKRYSHNNFVWMYKEDFEKITGEEKEQLLIKLEKFKNYK